MRITALLLFVCASMAGLSGCDSQHVMEKPTDATVTSPDNTEINERDADGRTLTPLDQGQGEADIERTAEIRRKVLAAEGMSVNARNAKIITNNGKVTLRGPVTSADEKANIERIAVEVAGNGNVNNELEVAVD